MYMHKYLDKLTLSGNRYPRCVIRADMRQDDVRLGKVSDTIYNLFFLLASLQ